MAKYKIKQNQSYIEPLSKMNLGIFKKATSNYYKTLNNNTIDKDNIKIKNLYDPNPSQIKIGNLQIPYSKDAALCSDMSGKCAKYVMSKINPLGYNLHFDAWTMNKAINSIGGKKIYGLSLDLPKDLGNNEMQVAKSRQLIEEQLDSNPFDSSKLKEGQMISLYNPTSNYEAQALNNGNGLTHVGIVVTNPESGELEIEHNWGGSIKHLTMDDLPDSDLRVAGVYELPKLETQTMKDGGKFEEQDDDIVSNEINSIDNSLNTNINQRGWMDFIIDKIYDSDDGELKMELNYGTKSNKQDYNRKRQRYNLASKIKENYKDPNKIKNRFLRNAIYERYYKDFATSYLKDGGKIIDKAYHVVKQDETLYSIANSYGLSVDDLMEKNPDIKDANQIQYGQKLNIDTKRTPNESLTLLAEDIYNSKKDLVKDQIETPKSSKDYKFSDKAIMFTISQEAPADLSAISTAKTPDEIYKLVKKKSYKLYKGSDGNVTTPLGTVVNDMEGVTMSGDEVVKRFKESVNKTHKFTKAKFKNFEYLPDDYKDALLILAFNNGANKIGNLYKDGKDTGITTSYRKHVESVATKFKNKEPILKSDISNIMNESDFNTSRSSNNNLHWLTYRSIASALLFAGDFDYDKAYAARFNKSKSDVIDYKRSVLTKLNTYAPKNLILNKYDMSNIKIK